MLFFVHILLINSCSSFESLHNSSSENNDSSPELSSKVQNFESQKKRTASKKLWFTQLFAEAQIKFDMKTVNEKCEKDYQTYKTHLYENQSIWAIRSEYPSLFNNPTPPLNYS